MTDRMMASPGSSPAMTRIALTRISPTIVPAMRIVTRDTVLARSGFAIHATVSGSQ